MKWGTGIIRICISGCLSRLKSLKEKGYQLKAIKHALESGS